VRQKKGGTEKTAEEQFNSSFDKKMGKGEQKQTGFLENAGPLREEAWIAPLGQSK